MMSLPRLWFGMLAAVLATAAAASEAPAGSGQNIRLRNSIAQISVPPSQKTAGAAFVSGVTSPKGARRRAEEGLLWGSDPGDAQRADVHAPMADFTVASPQMGPLLRVASAPVPPSDDAPSVTRARYLWSQSPHGKMLERILPRAIEPGQLPEPQSEGARLAAQYCVQCHYLPNPQMHTASNWEKTVERMVWRMQGKGNMGRLMKEMMDNVKAPSEEELATLAHYLRKHGQKEIDPQNPGLKTTAGQMFSIACSQCHALPDPRRHTANEWPRVVQRMKQHMSWANIVVGASELRTTPELDTHEIIRFLQRYARKEHSTQKP